MDPADADKSQRCGACGYALGSARIERCPECGWPRDLEARRERSWRVALAACHVDACLLGAVWALLAIGDVDEASAAVLCAWMLLCAVLSSWWDWLGFILAGLAAAGALLAIGGMAALWLASATVGVGLAVILLVSGVTGAAIGQFAAPLFVWEVAGRSGMR